MTVARIATKVHGKEFARRYVRFSREDSSLEIHPKRASREWPQELDGIGPIKHALVTEEPASGLARAIDDKLHDWLEKPNDLLVYRVLRALYGPPDILSVVVSVGQRTAFREMRDWGFCLQLPLGVVAEIRTVERGARSRLRLWKPRAPFSIENHEAQGAQVARFIGELNRLLELNLHMFNERVDLEERALRPGTTLATINVFAKRYQTAVLFLAYPIAIEKPKRSRGTKAVLATPVNSSGSRYLAAASFFSISLESFVNSLYFFLLKDQFRDKRFDRLVVRSDLDVRILSLSSFCNGFRRAPIAPNSDLLARISRIRDFRNNVLHGNITEENQLHALVEDDFTFYYWPGQHFRGTRKHRAAAEDIPTGMTKLVEADARCVKQVVDDTIQAVRSAMDKSHRAWLESWIDQGMIPWPGLLAASIPEAKKRSRT